MDCNKKIQIIDVGPRDGFQNVKSFIDTPTKLAIIDGLYQSGIREIEVTSFVSPKAIPQMVDAADVAKAVIARYADLRPIALVPNLRGAENAFESGIREVVCVISASEAHNSANVNRTIDESLASLNTIIKALPTMQVRLDVATAFGCPFSGKVPEENVLHLVEAATKLGVQGITLCDTIGVANPAQVRSLLAAMQREFPATSLALHFHNTRGMGLANICVAAGMGVRDFETSAGGLGGCPFAPGSEGNTATEDTIHMLHEMGYETGVDLDKLLGTVQCIADHVDAPLTGKMLGVHKSTCSNISGNAN